MLARTIAQRSARSMGAISQTREFAKKAAPKKAAAAAKAPKELFGVHGRYATALFLAADKAKCTDKVEKELAVSISCCCFVPHAWCRDGVMSMVVCVCVHCCFPHGGIKFFFLSSPSGIRVFF